MGLFDELDIAGAADNPWAIPDNTYQCVVSDLEVKPNSKGNRGMTFKYKITDGEHAGKEISEYKSAPSKEDKDQSTPKQIEDARSYIKQRLASLDIPEDRMNDITKEDLVGIQCYVSVKDRDGYANVRKVSTSLGAGESTSGPEANPFA